MKVARWITAAVLLLAMGVVASCTKIRTVNNESWLALFVTVQAGRFSYDCGYYWEK